MTTEKLLTEWLEVYQKEHIKARTYRLINGKRKNNSITFIIELIKLIADKLYGKTDLQTRFFAICKVLLRICKVSVVVF